MFCPSHVGSKSGRSNGGIAGPLNAAQTRITPLKLQMLPFFSQKTKTCHEADLKLLALVTFSFDRVDRVNHFVLRMYVPNHDLSCVSAIPGTNV